MKKILLGLAVIFTSIALVGCDIEPVLKLVDNVVVLKVDEEFKLEIDEASGKGTLIWSSSDTEVVSVDNEGNIKALSEGKVTVTLKYDDNDLVSDKVEVYVDNEIVAYQDEAILEINTLVDGLDENDFSELVWASIELYRIAAIDDIKTKTTKADIDNVKNLAITNINKVVNENE